MNEIQREIIECAVADGFTYKKEDTLRVERAKSMYGNDDLGEWWIQTINNSFDSYNSLVRRVTDEDLKQWRRDKKIDEILPNT
jgi:hypothetical protein